MVYCNKEPKIWFLTFDRKHIRDRFNFSVDVCMCEIFICINLLFLDTLEWDDFRREKKTEFQIIRVAIHKTFYANS